GKHRRGARLQHPIGVAPHAAADVHDPLALTAIEPRRPEPLNELVARFRENLGVSGPFVPEPIRRAPAGFLIPGLSHARPAAGFLILGLSHARLLAFLPPRSTKRGPVHGSSLAASNAPEPRGPRGASRRPAGPRRGRREDAGT